MRLGVIPSTASGRLAPPTLGPVPCLLVAPVSKSYKELDVQGCFATSPHGDRTCTAFPYLSISRRPDVEIIQIVPYFSHNIHQVVSPCCFLLEVFYQATELFSRHYILFDWKRTRAIKRPYNHSLSLTYSHTPIHTHKYIHTHAYTYTHHAHPSVHLYEAQAPSSWRCKPTRISKHLERVTSTPSC